MEPDLTPIGNQVALFVERLAYLGLGIFFLLALYRGIQRNRKDRP